MPQDTTKDDVSFFKEEFADALIKLVPIIEQVFHFVIMKALETVLSLLDYARRCIVNKNFERGVPQVSDYDRQLY